MGQWDRKDVMTEGSAVVVAGPRRQARAIMRVLDQDTHEVVGWLYEWNTGETSVMWKAGKRENVVFA